MSSRRQHPANMRSAVSSKRSRSEPLIDSLPEGIMHDIVSRLTLKDAVRTSCVSTTWRRLWRCHPDLCFDGPTILNREPGSRSRRRRHRFIRRVNAILESHDGTRLRRFKIAFTLDIRHAKYLDPWLNFALDSKASILSVNLRPVLHKGSVRSWEETYTLPVRMFSSQCASCIEMLQLGCVSLKPPHDFDGFANLRVLDLEYVYMLGGNLDLLLSKCNALECLRLSRCCPMPNLKVQQPLCRLSYLSVRECLPRGMEFNAPNLTKLDYSGQAIPITLSESMKLTQATVALMGYDDTLEHVLTELPKTLSHVETLSVRTCINTEVFGFSRCLVKYNHLIKLEVTVSILGDSRNRNGILRLANLLEVAHHLQRLELNMLPHVSTGFLNNVPEAYWHIQPCTHRHLEQVEVSGFIGVNGQLELVLYILDNAVALRGMSIEPRVTAYDRVFGYWAGLDIDIKTGRECVLKNILPEDYPDVQIEIF
ncbi:F-box/FBD/LRR-repeat protein At1g13570 [Lolium perenne]|uniref:F-box/FBD/LRR-repeat protein At1g13570 n=1 Tax=Lolium perenne TaxID=4522 RepID=UPI0021F63627|nr:F-box protein At5g03100-like [Lolium perenne]